MSVAGPREDYARGLIDLAEFERHVERALLRDAGPNHPLPDGWAALPPCNHDEWIDLTSIGASERRLICRDCGRHQSAALPAITG